MNTNPQQEKSHEVKVVDVSIPFGSMVTILVKVSLAAIPAALILASFGVALALVVKAMLVS